MVPLFTATDDANRDDENFYLNMFQSLEIHKSGFYFAYTYDLTHTLQENIIRKIVNRMETVSTETHKVQVDNLKCPESESKPWESMFMWNKHLV